MDPLIKELQYTDNTTKQILENVRKKKKKFDVYKQLHFYTFYLVCIMAFIFLYHFYQIASQYTESFLSVISVFLNDEKSMVLFVILFVLYFVMSILKQEKEKKDKEFNELRCEIVDRSKDLWKLEEQWKNRHEVFAMMKKQFDINLYNEKK